MNNRDIVLMEWIRTSDDQKAFEYLFHLYYSPLCNYTFGFVKNHSDAEDLVNDCFFELWKNRKTLVIQSSVKSYLYISARNKSVNFLKKKSSHQRYLKNQSYPFTFQNEITHHTELLFKQENLEDRMKKAIDRLPAQCRQIFYLNRFEGMKYREIAQKLNLAETTIKTQIARALKSLRDDLDELKSSFFLFFRFRST